MPPAFTRASVGGISAALPVWPAKWIMFEKVRKQTTPPLSSTRGAFCEVNARSFGDMESQGLLDERRTGDCRFLMAFPS